MSCTSNLISRLAVFHSYDSSRGRGFLSFLKILNWKESVKDIRFFVMSALRIYPSCVAENFSLLRPSYEGGGGQK